MMSEQHNHQLAYTRQVDVARCFPACLLFSVQAPQGSVVDIEPPARVGYYIIIIITLLLLYIVVMIALQTQDGGIRHALRLRSATGPATSMYVGNADEIVQNYDNNNNNATTLQQQQQQQQHNTAAAAEK